MAIKIERRGIDSTPMIDLNYDLTKNGRARIPKELGGSIVRVNITGQKGETSKAKIFEIIEKIRDTGALLVILGHVKTLAEDAEREEKKLSIELSGFELIKAFVDRFAPKEKERRKVIMDEVASILADLEKK